MDLHTVDVTIKLLWKIYALCRAFYLLFFKKNTDEFDNECGWMWLAISIAV